MFKLQNKMGKLFYKIEQKDQDNIFEFHETDQIQSLLRWFEINLDELIKTRDILISNDMSSQDTNASLYLHNTQNTGNNDEVFLKLVQGQQVEVHIEVV